jgi:hypothetical protein
VVQGAFWREFLGDAMRKAGLVALLKTKKGLFFPSRYLAKPR